MLLNISVDSIWLSGYYNDIKRVFSIWVCMNMDENSMDYIHLADDKLLGSYPWRGRFDLLNIVLIGIAKKLPKQEEKYELHRLLNTLLSMELSVTEKLDIMETEYCILTDGRIREDVNEMCNLSQGILEKGEAKGKARTEVKFILSMYEKDYTIEQIADIAEKSIEEVKSIIEKKMWHLLNEKQWLKTFLY